MSVKQVQEEIDDIVADTLNILNRIYKGKYESDKRYLKELTEMAMLLAHSNISDADAIRQLGEGWVAEETLAIALYCVLKYPDNFEKAIVASVNHSGDSDSTGMVTGNIMGALFGYEAIPNHYIDNLELKWLIEELSKDLSMDIPVGEYGDNYDTHEKIVWMKKYVDVIEQSRVPIKNSYLVHKEMNIFAGEYPGDMDDDKSRMKITAWSKFKYFYDLTLEGELTPYTHHLGKDKVHYRFPIPDCGVPANTAIVARLCQEIIYQGENSNCWHNAIYIHCRGGVGRTGTIVSCLYAYLLRGQGLSIDEMYSQVMQQLQNSFSRCPKSRRRVSPENEKQREFIRYFIERECMCL